MNIRILSQNLINQIAAGEVIERPSSVIKELMENAIDAGANEIIVKVIDAGKNFISVSDNGCGMTKESIELSVISHATSKLTVDNLFNIHTFGFRGEALPSIASVSRMSVSSGIEKNNQLEAWRLSLEGNENVELSPINRDRGTTIEVRDLFFATPARLKFLKSDAYELDSCYSIFNRIALSHNHISFSLHEKNKEKFCYKNTDNLIQRIRDIFGDSFVKNIFEFHAEKDGMILRGYAGVPTFNKSSTHNQFFFVNNRFVKDKIFSSAMKSAYAGLIPNGRHAVAILFLDIAYNEVDVNAHPAKIEIRFRNAEKIRTFISSEIKNVLTKNGISRPSTELVDNFYVSKGSAFFNNKMNFETDDFFVKSQKTNGLPRTSNNITNNERFETVIKTEDISKISDYNTVLDKPDTDIQHKSDESKNFLGNAILQINNTYVISETSDGLVVVDQHAAAERILLEEFKVNLRLDSQNLLMPVVCNLTEAQTELLKENNEILLKIGIHIEFLSHDLISVNSVTALLGACDAKILIEDIIEELSMFGDIYSTEDKIHSILSSISCHNSLRAGKKLSHDEMNYLLRKMEKTTNVAQCCHGRPSYITISIKDLDKFFERS